MIAQSRTNEHRIDFVQNQFLTMLPQIRRQASIAFCGLGAEAREELLQEVIANAYCAFAQLVRRGKQAVAYPTPLAEFAIRQVRAGRRVGCRMNVRDILSSQLSRTHQLTIQRLNQCDRRTGLWTELLVEDRQAGPAEIAAARLDFYDWFRRLSVRNRQIARALALGERTADIARQFSLSPGRVSQLRNWFRTNWAQFQSGSPTEGYVA